MNGGMDGWMDVLFEATPGLCMYSVDCSHCTVGMDVICIDGKRVGRSNGVGTLNYTLRFQDKACVVLYCIVCIVVSKVVD